MITTTSSHFQALERLTQQAALFYNANQQNIANHRFMDILNDDVLRLLKSLNEHRVEYMLVGGLAGVFYGHIRTTADLDLWVKKTEDNQTRLVKALQENEVIAADLLQNSPLVFGWTSVRFGKNQLELDLGNELKAFKILDFDVCYARANQGFIEDVALKVLHINDLLTEKRTNPRYKDLADAEALEEIIKRLK